jgi:hypothetical protein
LKIPTRPKDYLLREQRTTVKRACPNFNAIQPSQQRILEHEANQHASTPDPDTPGKGSSRILIIVAMLVLIGVLAAGAIIAAAVGIMLYSRSSSSSAETNARAQQSGPPSGGTFPTPRPSGADKTDALVEALKRRTRIGDFELQNIIPSGDARIYGNSQGEARAVYTKGGDTVTLLAAEYASRAEASVEFGRMLGRERSRGARLVVQPKVNGDTINAAFESADEMSVAFCSWPEGMSVLCHQISSASGDAINEFRNSIRGTQ